MSDLNQNSANTWKILGKEKRSERELMEEVYPLS